MTMAKSFLLPALLAVTTSNLVSTVSGDEAPMIVGGSYVEAGVYPYYVMVNSVDGYMCGGTLIAPDVVLTAAHCGWAPNGNNVLEGGLMKVGAWERDTFAGGAFERYCRHYEEHPSYVPEGQQASDWHDFVDYDFALCKLDIPVDMDGWDIEIVLNDERNVPAGGETVTAIGLGRTSESGSTATQLKHADVPVSNQCYNNFDNDIKICAGTIGQGICYGDSGGPLVRIEGDVHYHIGVSSGTVDCEQSPFPGFFARTSAVMDWIEDIVCNEFESDEASFCATTPPPLLCEDDENFYWGTDEGKDCAWISSSDSRIANYCERTNDDGKMVLESCPETCGSKSPNCPTDPCANDENFYWGTDEGKTCAWIASSNSRIANYCERTNNDGKMVLDSCPVTCGSLPPGCPTEEPVPAPPTDVPVTPRPTEEPVAAPPTDEPVEPPPTEAPALFCKDDENFQWKTFEERTCAWLALQKPARIANYCEKTNTDGVLVADSCPETCDTKSPDCPSEEPVGPRCENNEDYYWKDFQDRTCAWIASNQNRINNYCEREDDDGTLVSEACPETCSSIPAECTTEEPVRCVNDEDFYWRTHETRTCEWIGSNINRIANYCERANDDGVLVLESCPETCDSVPAECTTPDPE